MEWKRKKKQQQQPRLQRLNAMKDINYQPPSSTSSLHSLSSDHQTSLRVMGLDGEFDRIFQSLGLSGPEDFAIPTADWEARKVRFPSSNSKESREQNRTSEVELDAVVAGANGRGINGVRPPILETASANVDRVSHNCELMKSFSPQDAVSVARAVVDSPCSSGEHGGSGIVGRLRHGERSGLFTDSSSFTTSHDDDSDVGGERGGCCSGSGVVDELVRYVSSNEWFRRTFSSWQKGEMLGKGSFGTVYEGYTDDGFFFAVKEVSLLDEGSQGKQSIFQLQQEISLLSQFEHENIVRYFGSDMDKSALYIFLELVSKGSLASLYLKYRLNDSQVSAYTRQILRGLQYLHDRGVVHRDIKCANILVDVSGSVKLADFGLAKATKLNDVKSSKGSPYWMAPEVVNLRNQGYGLPADIWSLGCTVLEMLTRQPPYSDLEGMQALFRIGKGEPPPIPESLSKEARDFILKCLQVNPCKRPTAAQLLDHPFVRRRSFQSPITLASPQIGNIRL